MGEFRERDNFRNFDEALEIIAEREEEYRRRVFDTPDDYPYATDSKLQSFRKKTRAIVLLANEFAKREGRDPFPIPEKVEKSWSPRRGV